MEELNTLYEEINTKLAKFNEDHQLAMAGNKAAARRCRVISVQIRKAFEDYRKKSLKA